MNNRQLTGHIWNDPVECLLFSVRDTDCICAVRQCLKDSVVRLTPKGCDGKGWLPFEAAGNKALWYRRSHDKQKHIVNTHFWILIQFHSKVHESSCHLTSQVWKCIIGAAHTFILRCMINMSHRGKRRVFIPILLPKTVHYKDSRVWKNFISEVPKVLIAVQWYNQPWSAIHGCVCCMQSLIHCCAETAHRHRHLPTCTFWSDS